MNPLPYSLGCPIWANKEWVGDFFTSKAQPKDFLRQYASVFNSVEGNTTFYGLPSPKIVEKWNRETPESFQFYLKFPKTITHEKCLQHTEKDLFDFFALFEPLQAKLGPFLIQLPAAFGSHDLPTLQTFLQGLPAEFRYSVEVRHPEFFLGGRAEQELNGLLVHFAMDRVLFDARPLHRAKKKDIQTLEAQRKKPLLPIRPITTAQYPILRYISHPDLSENEIPMLEWAQHVARWIQEKKKPAVFIHTIDNFYAPLQCQKFHHMLQNILQIENLPLWPVESEIELQEKQMTLFTKKT